MSSLRASSRHLYLALALAFGSLSAIACDSGSSNSDGDGGTGGDGDGGFADADDNPTPGSDAACPAVNAVLTPVTPTVLLLLDQSGSMTANFGGKSRYNAMKDALVGADGVVKQLDGEVIFGASLYTSHNGTQGGTCPILDTVTPAIDNFAGINTLLTDNAPDGDTPTGESIQQAVTILNNVGQDPDAPASPKIIVLATDGEPDTCAVPNPQTGQSTSIAAAQASFTAGIRLFILSVGNEVGLGHQQDMANAGAGKKLDHSDGDAKFYTADNPGELKAAFDEIIGGVRECTFAISGSVDPNQAADGTVLLNGNELVFDDPNGWSLVDDKTMKLNGTACDDFLADSTATLSAQFPCGVIVD
jgi:hypothetical protein